MSRRFFAVILALTAPLPVEGAQKVALPTGEVLHLGGMGGSTPRLSLETIEKSVHNGRSSVHNALWRVITASAVFDYDDAVKIYNFALSSEGRLEFIHSMNGDNLLHQKVPDALFNFNTWATRNGFPPIAISTTN